MIDEKILTELQDLMKYAAALNYEHVEIGTGVAAKLLDDSRRLREVVRILKIMADYDAEEMSNLAEYDIRKALKIAKGEQ